MLRAEDMRGMRDPHEDFMKKTFQTEGSRPDAFPVDGSSATKYGVVDNARLVRMHKYPNSAYSNVIATVSKGIRVEILGEEEGYLKVLPVAPGGNYPTGYIKKEYVTEV